jgi:hypothetical protein
MNSLAAIGKRLLPLIMQKVEPEPMSGCWLWTGKLSQHGYGSTWIGNGRCRPTHRLVWAAMIGEPTPGLELDHKCRVRLCCNPRHLREVTKRENVLAPGAMGMGARHSRKTHCINGHPLLVGGDPRGWRVCRVCRRAESRRHYSRYREAVLAQQRKRYRRNHTLEVEP